MLVLDLASEVGAYGTRLLAELGHDVIRVERPSGDTLRRCAPHLAPEPALEASAFHQFLNAGKRSLAVDLESAAGRRIFVKLAATADAVVASLPLPRTEGALRDANRNLVVVRIDDGPPELIAFARSGLLAITGEPDGKPTLLGGHVPWSAVGLYVAMTAVAALLAPAGQIVDVFATECLASLAEQVWVEYSMSGERLERLGSKGGITALAGALPCADGHWMVSVPPDAKGWSNFVQLVPDPAFKDDAALADEALRRERKTEILDRIALWSRHRKKDEIVADAQRLHIPAAPVANPLELIADPQLLTRGFLKPVDHPVFGQINFPMGALASLFGQEMRSAPRLGEHTASILATLGYAASEIEGLARDGIIRTGDFP
jgi:crotonobetainyl-CoA:carnitine CoA-transferase CaiB-like acyl-CoA transferase